MVLLKLKMQKAWWRVWLHCKRNSRITPESWWGAGMSSWFIRILPRWSLLSFLSRAHLADKSVATRAFYRTILMKGFHVLVTILCTRNIQDTQCGFKLFTNEVAKVIFENLHLNRWAFDIELIYQAEALGVHMDEVSWNVVVLGLLSYFPVHSLGCGKLAWSRRV